MSAAFGVDNVFVQEDSRKITMANTPSCCAPRICTKLMRKNSEHDEGSSTAGASWCICDGHAGMARTKSAFTRSTDVVKLTSAGVTAAEKLKAFCTLTTSVCRIIGRSSFAEPSKALPWGTGILVPAALSDEISHDLSLLQIWANCISICRQYSLRLLLVRTTLLLLR